MNVTSFDVFQRVKLLYFFSLLFFGISMLFRGWSTEQFLTPNPFVILSVVFGIVCLYKFREYAREFRFLNFLFIYFKFLLIFFLLVHYAKDFLYIEYIPIIYFALKELSQKRKEINKSIELHFVTLCLTIFFLTPKVIMNDHYGSVAISFISSLLFLI